MVSQYIYIYIYICIYVYLYMYTYMYVCICVCVYLYVHSYICIYIYIFIYLFISVYTCVYVNMYRNICRICIINRSNSNRTGRPVAELVSGQLHSRHTRSTCRASEPRGPTVNIGITVIQELLGCMLGVLTTAVGLQNCQRALDV